MTKVFRVRTLVFLLALSLIAVAAAMIPVATSEAIPGDEGTCFDPQVCTPTCPCSVVCVDRWGNTTTCGAAGASCVP